MRYIVCCILWEGWFACVRVNSNFTQRIIGVRCTGSIGHFNPCNQSPISQSSLLRRFAALRVNKVGGYAILSVNIIGVVTLLR